MVVNKISASFDEAIADVHDGAVIMFGGFTARGVASNLILALRKKGTKNLTVIRNDVSGGWRNPIDVDLLVEAGQVKKVITCWPVFGSPLKVSAVEKKYLAGEIEIEMVPQGTLVERIRAGGAGIGGFYTSTGVGTVVEEGKEKRVINGEEYLLELPLKADFAFIRAHKADKLGNLVYRKSARNFNPIMATAARVTIAEVDEIVEPGELDPDTIVTPCIFVHRIVKIPEGRT